MKQILFGVLGVLLSISAFADDYDDSAPFYAFYHLQVADPVALVDSMTRFWSSDCGKQYPADVALAQESFNGSSLSTHFIVNTFQKSADQAKAAEIMRSCDAGVQFLQELATAGSIPTTQYMGFTLIDANDRTKDTVFAKYDVIVGSENQAAYAASYAKMMKAVFKDSEVRSYGFGAVYYGRDKFTHWLWTGARSIPELTAIVKQRGAHPAFTIFTNEVSGMRTFVNASQIQMLQVWERQ
jgi:hypothetical protein